MGVEGSSRYFVSWSSTSEALRRRIRMERSRGCGKVLLADPGSLTSGGNKTLLKKSH